MGFWPRLVLFSLINFGGLAIGGLFTAAGGSWYLSLDRAPWTPPGWVFGVAWFTIMLTYCIFLASNWPKFNLQLKYLFAISWVLNLSWNPFFFYLHLKEVGLLILVLLTVCVFVIWLKAKKWGRYHLLLMPYLVWLVLAASLNAYVL